MSPDSFQGLRLRGGYVILRFDLVNGPMVDAIGRPALAKAQIVGRELHLTILSSLSDEEKSVTVYHEILEAMTVAVPEAPADVQDFNESDFEKAAYAAHRRYGTATPENLDRMLHFHGFQEE